MTKIGYALSSEEHTPQALVDDARRAEEAGFEFALISDHFHPWIDKQGHSPFVWSVIGGISQATERLELGTGVTCPTMRIHPAIIAQAAATSALLMPERFFLGVGTGENLNEHILGYHWPPWEIRIEMLAEAVEIIRLLWEGENTTFYGAYYTVEDARLYSVPDKAPPVMVAAGGDDAAERAGKFGDGLISTSPKAMLVERFESAAGDKARPRYGQVTVCWAKSEEEALNTAYEQWPNTALPGSLSQELRMPLYFEQAAKLVDKQDVKKKLVLGPDPQAYLENIQKFVDAGYDHVYIHQIGPDQEGFIDFAKREILPEFK
jgi:G6PDH family F420-dependent oxidoreductase